MTARAKDHRLEKRNRASAQGKAVQEQIIALERGDIRASIAAGQECVRIDKKADGLEEATDLTWIVNRVRAEKERANG